MWHHERKISIFLQNRQWLNFFYFSWTFLFIGNCIRGLGYESDSWFLLQSLLGFWESTLQSVWRLLVLLCFPFLFGFQKFVLEEASGADPQEMLDQISLKGVSQTLCINDLGESIWESLILRSRTTWYLPHTYVHMNRHLYMQICRFMSYTYMYVCMFVYMHICMSTCTYIFFVYINTYRKK